MPSSDPAAARDIPRPPLNDLPGLLRFQSEQCAVSGSPLYGNLLDHAAVDVEEQGPCLAVLRGHERDPAGTALALRFMGGVHRMVLEGNAPDLAAHYPSAGGSPRRVIRGRFRGRRRECHRCASGSRTACRRMRSSPRPARASSRSRSRWPLRARGRLERWAQHAVGRSTTTTAATLGEPVGARPAQGRGPEHRPWRDAPRPTVSSSSGPVALEAHDAIGDMVASGSSRSCGLTRSPACSLDAAIETARYPLRRSTRRKRRAVARAMLAEPVGCCDRRLPLVVSST
jgi:hypothetical protein